MNKLNEKIIANTFKLYKRDKLISEAMELENEIANKSTLKFNLAKKLKQEKKDLSKLEKSTLASLITKINLSNNAIREKEKTLILKSMIDYKQCCSELERLQYDYDRIQVEINDSKSLLKENEMLIKEKEKELQGDSLIVYMKCKDTIDERYKENEIIMNIINTANKVMKSLAGLMSFFELKLEGKTTALYSNPMMSNVVHVLQLDECQKEINSIEMIYEQLVKDLYRIMIEDIDLIDYKKLMSLKEYIYEDSFDYNEIYNKLLEKYTETFTLNAKIRNIVSDLSFKYARNIYEINDCKDKIIEIISIN